MLVPLLLFVQSGYSVLPNVRFAAVGDWGCGNSATQTENNIKSKNPNLVLALGDYSYADTATCWYNIIKSTDSITKINIGNHETISSTLENSYMNHFHLTSQYYAFDYPPSQPYVHVLTMSTEKSTSSGSSQFNFVKNDLQTASQKPNIKWIIVNMHKAVYSSPNACGASGCQGSPSVRDVYHPLFDQYGVDLVLEGHTHNYQRTFPLKYNTADHSKPIKTSTNKNTYTNPDGQIYAIVGIGGVGFHTLGTRADFTAVQHGSRFGILDLAISNDGSKLDAKNYGNDGSVLDSFTITKSNSPPVANNQAISVVKNTAKPITLTATDPEGSSLAYTILTQPSHGTLSGTAPSLTYTPASGYTGPDSSTFKVNDGQVDSNTATISITVSDTPVGGYHYDPSFSATGSNFHEVSSSSSLQIPKFTVAAWFKTSKTYTAEGFILTKGGIGSDSSGQNMNYGLWITTSQKISGGFETSTGTDAFATSSGTYNDGLWHYGVVTYDLTAVRLYVDGIQVGTLSASSSPETSGTLPVRIGANSRAVDRFFTGSLDEGRIWNRALSSQEVTDAFNGIFNAPGQVLYVPFGSGNTPPVANNQALSTATNTAKGLTLTASDPENNPLTYTVLTQPSHGTLAGTAPSLTYTPVTDYTGPDSFTFKANDGNADSNIATVSISITSPSDSTPPTVVSTNPASGVTGIAVTSTVTATFSEPVQGSTVMSSFTLKAGTTPVSGQVTLSQDQKTATFTPSSSSLAASTSYTATITTGVKDTTGNAMTADKVWSFTTAAASPPSCSNLPVSSITASSSQSGFPPTDAIDNDFNTKWWSTFIVNPWIQADLGAQKSVCSVDIAWADGATRQYSFTISLSLDGSSYTNVFSGKSSGTSTSSEKYNFATSPGRYVKITITQSHVGSASSIAQISELDIYGQASASSQVSSSSTSSPAAIKETMSAPSKNNTVTPRTSDTHSKYRPPLAKDDKYSTEVNKPILAAILENDLDPDGNGLNLLSVSSPTEEGGHVTINKNSTVTFTPLKDFVGKDSFSYTILDGKGKTDKARVDVTIKGTYNTEQNLIPQPPIKEGTSNMDSGQEQTQVRTDQKKQTTDAFKESNNKLPSSPPNRQNQTLH